MNSSTESDSKKPAKDNSGQRLPVFILFAIIAFTMFCGYPWVNRIIGTVVIGGLAVFSVIELESKNKEHLRPAINGYWSGIATALILLGFISVVTHSASRLKPCHPGCKWCEKLIEEAQE